jgi:hypothetical protein
MRLRMAVADEVGDAARDDACLAGPGACQDQQRPLDVEDRLALLRIEGLEEVHGVAEDPGARASGGRGELSIVLESWPVFPSPSPGYSTVTLFARLRGWSTSQPRRTAMS